MSTKFTYVGGMCMLIQRSDGYKILVDPYLRKNKDKMCIRDRRETVLAGDPNHSR